LISENPFDGTATGSFKNSARLVFVTRETTAQAIAEAPDAEWRLIIALARYGGLRCPSELLALTWQDVDWERSRFKATSPKTKKQGKPHRWVPLFPELRPYLEAAFDAAPEGSVYVVERYRDPSQNLRTMFQRILKRAGVDPWERLFQNLRASRETELANDFPIHVVTEWLGNTPNVAIAHYLSATEDHFTRATAGPENDTAGALQKALHSAPEMGRNGAKSENGQNQESSKNAEKPRENALTAHAYSTPKGSRTPVAGLRTRSPRPLDDGGVALIVTDNR